MTLVALPAHSKQSKITLIIAYVLKLFTFRTFCCFHGTIAGDLLLDL